MTIRGIVLQFFYFPFSRQKGFPFSSEEINKKIFKSSPTLPPSPSCLLLAGKGEGLPQLLDFADLRRVVCSNSYMLNAGPVSVLKSPGFGKRG